jgi:hypothetical protein
VKEIILQGPWQHQRFLTSENVSRHVARIGELRYVQNVSGETGVKDTLERHGRRWENNGNVF